MHHHLFRWLCRGCGKAEDDVGTLSNVLFRNVHVVGPSTGNFIRGFSAGRQISNVRFDDVWVNGSQVHSAAELNLTVGPFAQNISFS